MVTTRMETTHGLTYSARVIKVTTWQSLDAFCLYCVTDGSLLKSLDSISSDLGAMLLTIAQWRLPVVHVKKDGYSLLVL